MSKRCICGKSGRWPLCDGSHKSLGWTCSVQTRAPYAFVAGRNNENLAERLASELEGVAVHAVASPIRAGTLVVIADTTSLHEVRELTARVQAAAWRVVALELDPSLASQLFPEADIRVASGADALELWRSVHAAATRESLVPTPAAKLSPAFITHAVADEGAILPTLDYLRKHAGAELFLCADSIAAGSRWHDTILQELDRRPMLVWLLSKRSAASTFCSFEIGYAMASKKRIVIVSLDGERPPAFAQHLHALDLGRRRASRPWLTEREALADAVIEALSPTGS